MAQFRAVIETATNDVLRMGYCDFENDGTFDAGTETQVDVEPPLTFPGHGEVLRWNGTALVVVQRNLDVLKARKIKKLSKRFTKYLEDRYSPAVQRSLTLLMAEASSKNFTQRAENIQQGIDWVNLALAEFYTKRDVVATAINLAAIDVVELDLDTLDQSDPGLTLEGARAILD
jgi:hypothetical protein